MNRYEGMIASTALSVVALVSPVTRAANRMVGTWARSQWDQHCLVAIKTPSLPIPPIPSSPPALPVRVAMAELPNEMRMTAVMARTQARMRQADARRMRAELRRASREIAREQASLRRWTVLPVSVHLD